MATSAFCIATTNDQANRIVQNLRMAGFSGNDISILFPDKTSTLNFAHEKHTKAPEGAVTGAGSGVAVGAVLGWLAGIGSLAIPGLGPFIAAGPIMAALGGAAIAGTVGGVTGALIGMGMPEFEARRYEGRIRSGNFLISVHSADSTRNAQAKKIFRDNGAEDIAASGETGVPSQEKFADAKV